MNISAVFSGSPVTPDEILQCRADRVERQQKMLSMGGQCLVSFSMNIPGSIKQFPLAKSAFAIGIAELESALPGNVIMAKHLIDLPTGSEGLFLLKCSPETAKLAAMDLEEYHPLGRLFDIDVLDRHGRHLSRLKFGYPPRPCLLCGGNAKLCARSGTHSIEALRLRISQILSNYFRDSAANSLAACATRAQLYEISVTPKPGLVDQNNNGAHHDMNYFTFLDSCAALSPWFRKMVCLGWDKAEFSAKQLFPHLRTLGLQAERDMFAATGGINTHKGQIFSMGILCCALGQVHACRETPVPLDDLLTRCKALGQCSLRDFTLSAYNPPPHRWNHLLSGKRLYRCPWRSIQRFFIRRFNWNVHPALLAGTRAVPKRCICGYAASFYC